MSENRGQLNCTPLTETERYQIYVLKKANHRQKVTEFLNGRTATSAAIYLLCGALMQEMLRR